MSDDFEAIKEVGKKYKISESKLKKIILDNKIPHKKENENITINVRLFDRWMAANIKNLSSEKLFDIETDEKESLLSINPMLKEERLLLNPPDSTKMQILTRLVDTIVTSGATAKKNAKFILKAVIERERLCSTAITDGVAIPHPRSSMEKYVTEPILAVAISKRGIHFEADDGKPTKLFFLICANSIDIHLKVMARLSRLLRDAKFRHELTISENFEQVKEVFERYENKINHKI